ncbi:MAG: hypothetical protein GXP16_18575, partial [Gammaproteobacteria bacterium]|nr:hypothetical protein [Gammaproteobacteria bacterium]
MKRTTIVAGLVLFITSSTLWADQAKETAILAPASLNDVWIMAPKQGMQEQFEAAVREHVKFRVKAGDSRAWQVYSATIGGKTPRYQLRYCCFNWDEQDSYAAEDLKRGYSVDWNANVNQYVDQYEHYLEIAEWDNSHWPEGMGQYMYYGVTTWELKRGVGSGPDEARKQISQIALTKGWADAGNRWLWHSRIGGTPTLMLIEPFKDYADMAPSQASLIDYLAKHMGSAEKAKA